MSAGIRRPLASDRRDLSDIAWRIYVTPDPALVAKVFRECGVEAFQTRWHWLEPRTLAAIARTGRGILGGDVVNGGGRRRSSTAEQEAAAVEAAFVLDSLSAAERAAGLTVNSLRAIFQQRGLDWPRCSAASRAMSTADGHAAARGDEAAAARIEARRDSERHVYDVLRAALTMVPDQPATGRYRLPTSSRELAKALGDCEREAVETVFPSMSERDRFVASAGIVTPAEPAPRKPHDVSKGRRRKMPSDEEIRAAYGRTPRVATLADRWGVTDAAVYPYLRKLGLIEPRGAKGAAQPAALVSADPVENVLAFPTGDQATIEVVVDPVPVPSRALTVVPQARVQSRLTVSDLALAVDLARTVGLMPEDVIAWVRADLDASIA